MVMLILFSTTDFIFTHKCSNLFLYSIIITLRIFATQVIRFDAEQAIDSILKVAVATLGSHSSL